MGKINEGDFGGSITDCMGRFMPCLHLEAWCVSRLDRTTDNKDNLNNLGQPHWKWLFWVVQVVFQYPVSA